MASNSNSEFVPSCWRWVTLKDLVEKMSPPEREVMNWANEDGDIVMAKITWSKKGCELLHPGVIQHPAPYEPQTGVRIDEAYSLSRWGSDLTIIDLDENGENGLDTGAGDMGESRSGPGLEEVESDTDSEMDNEEPTYYQVEEGA